MTHSLTPITTVGDFPLTTPAGDGLNPLITPLFEDNFNNGSFNSDAVLTWGTPNNTSIQTINGTPAIEFLYTSTTDISEQRWSIATPQRALWQYQTLTVPDNYEHGTTNPTNRKLGTFWADGYSSNGDGPTPIWEFWNDGANGSNLAIHWSEGGYTVAGPHEQHTSFIQVPADRGRKMHLLFRVEMATNDTSNDGILQLYRMWDGDLSWTLFHTVTDANIPAPAGGPNGWQHGYLMGWFNLRTTVTSKFYIDDFKLYIEDPRI